MTIPDQYNSSSQQPQPTSNPSRTSQPNLQNPNRNPRKTKKSGNQGHHQELAMTDRGAPSARKMGGTALEGLDSARSRGEDGDEEGGVGYARGGGKGE